jgi:hypothetical protein
MSKSRSRPLPILLMMAAFLAAAFWSSAARAQSALACGPSNLGQTVCQAEGKCVCSFNQGGLMTRTPPGYSWDCNLLLGACASGPFPTLARTTAPYAEPGVALNAAAIREAQTALKRLGFDPGGVDGVVGPRTRAATRAFQQANGMNASGALSGETLERLRTAAPRR